MAVNSYDLESMVVSKENFQGAVKKALVMALEEDLNWELLMDGTFVILKSEEVLAINNDWEWVDEDSDEEILAGYIVSEYTWDRKEWIMTSQRIENLYDLQRIDEEVKRLIEDWII